MVFDHLCFKTRGMYVNKTSHTYYVPTRQLSPLLRSQPAKLQKSATLSRETVLVSQLDFCQEKGNTINSIEEKGAWGVVWYQPVLAYDYYQKHLKEDGKKAGCLRDSQRKSGPWGITTAVGIIEIIKKGAQAEKVTDWQEFAGRDRGRGLWKQGICFHLE